VEHALAFVEHSLLSWIGREQRLVAFVVTLRCGTMCFGCIIVFRCGFAMRVFCHVESSLWMMLQALETAEVDI